MASCPCELVEPPCSTSCSCANPIMSGGCYRCCKYGSNEQQKATANRLVAIEQALMDAPKGKCPTCHGVGRGSSCQDTSCTYPDGPCKDTSCRYPILCETCNGKREVLLVEPIEEITSVWPTWNEIVSKLGRRENEFHNATLGVPYPEEELFVFSDQSQYRIFDGPMTSPSQQVVSKEEEEKLPEFVIGVDQNQVPTVERVLRGGIIRIPQCPRKDSRDSCRCPKDDDGNTPYCADGCW